jgi:hypothetical protein
LWRVFFAGLILISSLQRIGSRAEAFGSNLLGSLVGGLLESLSYWTGLQALVLVAAGVISCRESPQLTPLCRTDRRSKMFPSGLTATGKRGGKKHERY